MSDEDSFSSDSDDEFLTLGKGGAGADGNDGDREAMIRKKLMESFYGKSAAAAAAAETPYKKSATSTVSSDDSSMDDEDGHDPSDPLRAEDLDAPQFNAAAHTQKHVFRGERAPRSEGSWVQMFQD